jgi:molecular chaperone Hsp33
MSSVHKVMSSSLTVRAAAVIATDVVEGMRKLHSSSPIPTLAVGKTMVGALLMASQLKQGQDVGVYLRGNGPLESVFAEATYEGAVRGYTPNPNLEFEAYGDSLKTGPALGIGLLTVVQSTPYSRQPHRGTVEMISGEVGDDLAYYFQQSLQIPSIVSLGVKLDTYGRVVAAGGVIVEVMPGVTDQEISQLEAAARKSQAVSELIAQGAGTGDLLKNYLNDFTLIQLEHPYEVKYECRCSKERLERALICLGPDELEAMIEDQNAIDTVCEFCGKKYNLSVGELVGLRAQAVKQGLH